MSNTSYEEMVKLLPMKGNPDKKPFEIELKYAEESITIKNLVDDTGIVAEIPLNDVSHEVLNVVMEFAKYQVDHPQAPKGDGEEAEQDFNTTELKGWYLDYSTKLQADQSILFETVLAANYLDMPNLLDMTCGVIAGMIKGKTPEEIRQTFNIENDFTPEEEEQVRKENEWCETDIKD